MYVIGFAYLPLIIFFQIFNADKTKGWLYFQNVSLAQYIIGDGTSQIISYNCMTIGTGASSLEVCKKIVTLGVTHTHIYIYIL